MTYYYNLIPGYVVRPERYGLDVFLNVGGSGWTDQQGLSRGWGTPFRGKAGVKFTVFDNLNVTGDFSNNWSAGQAMFTFPDHSVDGAVGISILVFFTRTPW